MRWILGLLLVIALAIGGAFAFGLIGFGPTTAPEAGPATATAPATPATRPHDPMADAGELFEDFHLTRRDDKHSDEEERWISVGQLNDDVVILVWTPRGEDRRIVTMWKVNDRERNAYYQQRERSG